MSTNFPAIPRTCTNIALKHLYLPSKIADMNGQRSLQHNVTDDALEHFHTNVFSLDQRVTYEVYDSLFQVKRPGESTPPPMQLSDDPNIPDIPQFAKYTP